MPPLTYSICTFLPILDPCISANSYFKVTFISFVLPLLIKQSVQVKSEDCVLSCLVETGSN